MTMNRRLSSVNMPTRGTSNNTMVNYKMWSVGSEKEMKTLEFPSRDPIRQRAAVCRSKLHADIGYSSESCFINNNYYCSGVVKQGYWVVN